MKKIFNIKVTIWGKWKIILIAIISSGLCTYAYNIVFPGKPNSYHIVKVLGGLIVISFISIYKTLLYTLRIEIDDVSIAFYKQNVLIYKNTKDKLRNLRILKNTRNDIVELKICFEDRNFILYSPIKLQSKKQKINNIEDVFHYLVKNYNLKRKKVYGKVLGFGKKFENKLINEYWNKKYITSDS